MAQDPLLDPGSGGSTPFEDGWTRPVTGEWAPGGALDESTRARRRQEAPDQLVTQILTQYRQAVPTQPQGLVGGMGVEQDLAFETEAKRAADELYRSDDFWRELEEQMARHDAERAAWTERSSHGPAISEFEPGGGPTRTPDLLRSPAFKNDPTAISNVIRAQRGQPLLTPTGTLDLSGLLAPITAFQEGVADPLYGLIGLTAQAAVQQNAARQYKVADFLSNPLGATVGVIVQEVDGIEPGQRYKALDWAARRRAELERDRGVAPNDLIGQARIDGQVLGEVWRMVGTETAGEVGLTDDAKVRTALDFLNPTWFLLPGAGAVAGRAARAARVPGSGAFGSLIETYIANAGLPYADRAIGAALQAGLRAARAPVGALRRGLDEIPTRLEDWHPAPGAGAFASRQGARVTATARAPRKVVDAPVVTVRAVGTTQPLEFGFRVVEADELVASHLPTFQPNPAYPAEVQPRARERSASRQQIQTIARDLDTAQVLPMPQADGYIDRGSPIVRPDNVVESGNGRVIAITTSPRYGEYKAALMKQLPQYGITGADRGRIGRMKMPVLVRVRKGDMPSPVFAAEANARATLAMSPAEQAIADAGRINDDLLSGLTVGEDMTIEQALRSRDNAHLRTAFAATIPANERAALADAGGQQGAEFYRRMRAAMFAKAYPTEAGQNLLRLFTESADPVVRNVESAMFGALPRTVYAEALIREGFRDSSLSLGEDMARAVEEYIKIKQSGGDIKAELATRAGPALFGEVAPSAVQNRLLEVIAKTSRSAKPLRDFLVDYAMGVEAAPPPQQGTLLAGAGGVTKEELIERAAAKVESEKPATLFGEEAGKGGTPTSLARFGFPGEKVTPQAAAPAVPELTVGQRVEWSSPAGKVKKQGVIDEMIEAKGEGTQARVVVKLDDGTMTVVPVNERLAQRIRALEEEIPAPPSAEGVQQVAGGGEEALVEGFQLLQGRSGRWHAVRPGSTTRDSVYGAATREALVREIEEGTARRAARDARPEKPKKEGPSTGGYSMSGRYHSGTTGRYVVHNDGRVIDSRTGSVIDVFKGDVQAAHRYADKLDAERAAKKPEAPTSDPAERVAAAKKDMGIPEREEAALGPLGRRVVARSKEQKAAEAGPAAAKAAQEAKAPGAVEAVRQPGGPPVKEGTTPTSAPGAALQGLLTSRRAGSLGDVLRRALAEAPMTPEQIASDPRFKDWIEDAAKTAKIAPEDIPAALRDARVVEYFERRNFFIKNREAAVEALTGADPDTLERARGVLPADATSAKLDIRDLMAAGQEAARPKPTGRQASGRPLFPGIAEFPGGAPEPPAAGGIEIPPPGGEGPPAPPGGGDPPPPDGFDSWEAFHARADTRPGGKEAQARRIAEQRSLSREAEIERDRAVAHAERLVDEHLHARRVSIDVPPGAPEERGFRPEIDLSLEDQLAMAKGSDVARRLIADGFPLDDVTLAAARRMPYEQAHEFLTMQRNVGGRGGRLAGEIASAALEAPMLLRSVVSFLDHSAAGLQTGFLLTDVGRGGTADLVFRNSLPALKAAITEGRYEQFMKDAVLDHPMFTMAAKAGVPFTDIGGPLTQMEEVLMSRAVGKIPLLAQSQRLMTGYLNKTRIDAFARWVEMARARKPDGVLTDKELEGLGTLTGIMTGRARLPLEPFKKVIRGAERTGEFVGIPRRLSPAQEDALAKTMESGLMVGMSLLLWAPRLYLSRLAMLPAAVVFKLKGQHAAAEIAAGIAGKFIAGNLILLGLAKGVHEAGVEWIDADLDHRSNTYGMVRVSNNHIDMWAGQQQFFRRFAQAIAGERISGAGDVIQLDGKQFPGDTRWDWGISAITSKEAPHITRTKELVSGETFTGEEVTGEHVANELTTPISVGSIVDAIRAELGSGMLAAGAIVGALNAIGFHVVSPRTEEEFGLGSLAAELVRDVRLPAPAAGPAPQPARGAEPERELVPAGPRPSAPPGTGGSASDILRRRQGR